MYVCMYILIKKIFVMHSMTKTLKPGVHKPGVPKLCRLVVGRQFGENEQELHENYRVRIFGSK